MPTLTLQQRRDVIALLARSARQSMRDYGVPASVTIAQAVLESGWMQSQLARFCNNLFGVKAYQRGDAYVELPTKEVVNPADPHFETVVARFKKYSSITDCFQDHARLLANAPRYAAARAVQDDPLAYAAALQSCGYSTNPKYASELVALIDQYKLQQYDKEEAA